MRRLSALGNAVATIGNADARLLYLGIAPGFEGVDQINMLIPRSLIGKGEVPIKLYVEGKVANEVTINIK